MHIGVDMDNVLVETAAHFVEHYNERYGTDVRYHDLHDYHLERVFDEDPDKFLERLHEFMRHERLDPVPGAKTAIFRLAAEHDLSIVTARSKGAIRETSLEWIRTHFPDIFDRVVHAGTHHELSKADACRTYGIDVHIDDAAHHIRDCADAGIRPFLFQRPWNKEEDVPSVVRRVKSWDAIVEDL
jgi:5'(3')-deoxyribonucleotidase